MPEWICNQPVTRKRRTLALARTATPRGGRSRDGVLVAGVNLDVYKQNAELAQNTARDGRLRNSVGGGNILHHPQD